MGRGVVLLSFILLPAVAVHAVRRRNVVLLLVLTAIVYRALVLALLAFADGRLTTAAYPFHLVNLVVGLFLVGQVAGRLLRRRRAL
jgi:NADH:ubiquinone oxidoreductase subunit K